MDSMIDLPTYLADRPTFPSIDALYDERGGRRSPECDFGVWWATEQYWPRYRLTWIEDTGDLYAADQASGRIVLVAVIPPDTFPEPDERRYLALDLDATRPLYGWNEYCGPLGGLAWAATQTELWAP